MNLTGHRGQPVLGSPFSFDWVESLRDFGLVSILMVLNGANCDF